MSQTLRRALTIDPASYDEEARTIELCYATTAPVDRYDYTEVLAISEDAIDTTRLDAGAVYLIRDHTPYGDPLGLIVSHRIDGDRAYATVRLSENDQVAGVLRDIASGLYRTCSVGYQVVKTETEETDSGTVVTVTRWMPFEVSMTVIPADINAQTRSNPSKTKGKQMAKKPVRAQREDETLVDETVDETNEIVVTVTPGADGVADVVVETVDVEDEDEDLDGEDEGVTIEDDRARAAAIMTLAVRHGVANDVVTRAVTNGTSEEDFRKMIKRTRAAGSPGDLNARARITRDERETRQTHAANALYARMRGGRVTEAEAGEFRSLRTVDLLRAAIGPSARRMDDAQVASMLSQPQFRFGMHTTSDFSFTQAAGSAIERRVREIYTNVESPLQPLVRETLVSDFRPVASYSIGGFPELRETPEGAEYEAGTVTTEAGTFSIRKYGRVLNLSFEAIINDDLRLLDTAIRGVAVKGVTLRNRLVREAFSAKMADGKALFHASHGNVINQPLDLAGLSAARAALRAQKDLDGEPMGLTARYLVVGPALETVAQQLVSPITAAVTGQVNPFAGTLEVIVDDVMTGTEWMLAADPAMADAIELADLRGYEGVQVEEITNALNDGISYRARTFAGASPTGFRGFVKSTGGV